MTEPAAQHYATLMGIARGYQRSQALAVAAELGIADLVRDGPRSAADLAAVTDTNAAALYRLLRALASIGVFHEDERGCFALTAMGGLLCRRGRVERDARRSWIPAGHRRPRRVGRSVLTAEIS